MKTSPASPAVYVLLLVFICLLVLLVFSAAVFGRVSGGARDIPAAIIRDTVASIFTARIYPEPVGGQMNVEVDGAHAHETLVFQLIRVNGDVVYSMNIHAVGKKTIKTLRRPMIDTGSYIYRVIRQSNGQMAQGRITFK